MTSRDGYDDRRESWRRIRVGLTGLVGILLIIGLAAAMLERIGPSASPVACQRPLATFSRLDGGCASQPHRRFGCQRRI